MDEADAIPRQRVIVRAVGVVLLLALLWAVSLYSYPLFHTMTELVGISVAVGSR